MRRPALASALAALLAAGPPAVVASNLYGPDSSVMHVNKASYEKLILKSNYTSVRSSRPLLGPPPPAANPAAQVVEFYAPWCGYCKSLSSDYEKVAKDLKGVAKVAAVNCDEASNQQFCSEMGVQGFPTLKIIRPSLKPGSAPVVEDYRGPRKADRITKAVVENINNHVKMSSAADVKKLLQSGKPTAILFSKNEAASALIRGIAIEFLGVITVAQVESKEQALVEEFKITDFPTLVVVPGKGQDPVVYDGALTKNDMSNFLRKFGKPNPDPAPDKRKAKAKPKPKAKPSKKRSPPSSSDEEAEAKAEPDADTTASTPDDADSAAAEAADSAPRAPEMIPIARLDSNDMLLAECLQPKSHTCILALVPSESSSDSDSMPGDKLVASLSQLNTKYIQGNRHMFPFFALPSEIEGSSQLREQLKLSSPVELIAINARRGWWRRHEGDHSLVSVEDWIDKIRMGEGQKMKLPAELVVEEAEKPAQPESSAEAKTEASSEAKAEASSEAKSEAPSEAAKAEAEGKAKEAKEDSSAEAEGGIKHEEL